MQDRVYSGHMCIFISNMKFLSLILWLGGLCTDADADATDNYAQRTNHDYIGLFGIIPNEPKTPDWTHDQAIDWILGFF